VNTVEYSRIVVVRGERDRGCLELPASSENTNCEIFVLLLAFIVASTLKYVLKSHNITQEYTEIHT